MRFGKAIPLVFYGSQPHKFQGRIPQAASAALRESVSVVDPRAHGQESRRPIRCYTSFFMATLKILDQKLLESLPSGTWVAISEDQERVVGTGATIEEALQQARKKGENNPSIVGTPIDRAGLIL